MPVTTDTTRDRIINALRGFIDGDLLDAATDLLAELGYESDLTLELSGDVDEFIDQLPAISPGTQTEKRFREQVDSIKIIHQITDKEIGSSASVQGILMDEVRTFDKGHNRSFIFVAAQLKGNVYSRGQYAEFTREINKRFASPCVVVFKSSANLVTLAFVNRREHKRDKERDVLGSVSLIRNIDPSKPHRAHVEILSELSLANMLEWMDQNNQPTNFDGLLKAWLAKLDTQELNNSFYRELFDWFERAVEEARFPTNQAKTLPSKEHVIRLITRLLFVWFMKEKGLIAEQLFTEERIEPLLKNYDPVAGDSYYRAVLQNLFFGTLNTEIDSRGFSNVNPTTHRIFSRYRYKKEISDPKALRALFDKTPFINGGLFDCLDTEESTRDGGYRIDCFTDNPRHKSLLSIPNHLFFGKGSERGIIDIFKRYKFTIEENTPAEQEVALDPELLGSVFENLLAAINPETEETVRRMTGSYYTPRVVVEYMVDEALTAYLTDKITPVDGDKGFLEDRIRYLLDYNDAFDDGRELFEHAEVSQLVEAIAKIKILDPAVGSGAFPMGMLHKLTLSLRRLDPHNHAWEALQKQIAVEKAEAAFGILDQRERGIELTTISDFFQQYRDSDFGRKLYLIQNSIFGVDKQRIACQIAKLRFFISLAIEQSRNPSRHDNFGIKPLPNLETRFVAADSLVGLDDPAQMTLDQTDSIRTIQAEISANRERYFHANVRQLKLEYVKRDTRLRDNLANRLEDIGMSSLDAKKISRLKLFDQNELSSWFDAWCFFNIPEGFDIVIGNPPYIPLQKHQGELADRYQDANYSTFRRSGDLYQLFYEFGFNMLASDRGVLSFISSNSWLKTASGSTTRRLLGDNTKVIRLLDLGKDVFQNAIVDTCILLVGRGIDGGRGNAFAMDRDPEIEFPPNIRFWGDLRVEGDHKWIILSRSDQLIADKAYEAGIPLSRWPVKINTGIKTGENPAFVIDDDTKRQLLRKEPHAAEIIKPLFRGEDLDRYWSQPSATFLIDTHNGYGNKPPVDISRYPNVKKHLDRHLVRLKARKDKGKSVYNLRSCAYYDDFLSEKIIWRRVAYHGLFSYFDDESFCLNAAIMISEGPLKFLCGVLNSTFVTWLMHPELPTSGTGTFHWERLHVKQVPIPKPVGSFEDEIVELVDEIIRQKQVDQCVNTRNLELEIDKLIYRLYGLTDDDIARVERYFQ